MNLSLLLRWSWRDLRAHWAKVLAIALVIGIGTGSYAGMTSTTEWRRISNTASYDTLGMYDLRVEVATGSTVDEGSIVEAISTIPTIGAVEAIDERLLFPTQVEASVDGEPVLVRGELTGARFIDGGPRVNGYHAFTGRLLDERDAGEPTAMVDRAFAQHYDLPDSGSIRIAGDRTVSFVAQATTPEYFYVLPEGEILAPPGTFAGVFTTLPTAQDIAGLPGQVNDAVLTLAPGAHRAQIASEIEAAVASLPVGSEVTTRDDNLSYTAMTEDVDNDQQNFTAMAMLLFVGAVGAAFNLIHRLAEQQRREIGISMALGVSPRRIALRPLLVSAEIAILGTVFGVGVGVLLGNLMRGFLASFVPLPIWETPFQFQLFIGVAIVGVIVPFAATIFPVRKAVRVLPVEAIRPPHLATQQHGKRRFRGLRANTFTVMPFRNLGRAKRRTAFTTMGISAVVVILVAYLGIVDSFLATLEKAEDEAVGDAPDRVVVTLDGLYPADAPDIEAIAAAESVEAAEPTLRVAATVAAGDAELGLLLELIDFETATWTPSVVDGSLGDGSGIVLARKAADDLGVSVGDTIDLRLRGAPASIPMTVQAIHPYPIRTFAYMDSSQAAAYGAAGLANLVQATPTEGFDVHDIQRELFPLESVASVQSVRSTTEAVEAFMGDFIGIIQVIAGAVVLLALLIAFNTAAINLDARAREHATMFAFGVPVRTATRMAVVESLLIGFAATIIGLAVGLGFVWFLASQTLAETLPDFEMLISLRPVTIAVVVALGLIAVALAPVLTVRRMRRMDLPGTLRLVE